MCIIMVITAERSSRIRINRNTLNVKGMKNIPFPIPEMTNIALRPSLSSEYNGTKSTNELYNQNDEFH